MAPCVRRDDVGGHVACARLPTCSFRVYRTGAVISPVRSRSFMSTTVTIGAVSS